MTTDQRKKNKLIANSYFGRNKICYFVYTQLIKVKPDKCAIKNLQFHDSLDWIMPVYKGIHLWHEKHDDIIPYKGRELYLTIKMAASDLDTLAIFEGVYEWMLWRQTLPHHYSKEKKCPPWIMEEIEICNKLELKKEKSLIKTMQDE